MATQSQKNAQEIIKLQGEIKLIHNKISTIKDNHLKHLDIKVNNEQARKTIQSYLTGSYFLDPIELYRLTIGLDKTINELPHAENVGERVRRYWEDVGQRSRTVETSERMGDAVYRISKSPIENSMNGNREHIRRKSFSEKLWEEKNCN